MADDIDIEEHDLLDHPVIKSIFPDLTVLKKEILDEESSHEEIDSEEIFTEDDEHNMSPVTENAVAHSKIDINPVLANNFLFHNDAKEVTNFDIKETQTLLCTNKIILGLKVNSVVDETHTFNEERDVNAATVKLKNIDPYLSGCKKYCQMCLILFPSKEAFTIHMKNCHFVQNNDNGTLPTDNDIQPLSEIKPKCNVCHKYFASNSSLGKHKRNIHFIRSRRSIKRNGSKNAKQAMLVVSDNIQKSNNSTKSCFHCNNVFPNMQSLIEHLYETLQTKKGTQSEDSNNSGFDNTLTKNLSNNSNKLLCDKMAQEEKNDIDKHGISKDESYNNAKYKKEYAKEIEKNSIPFPYNNEGKSTQGIPHHDTTSKYVYRCPICFYCFNNVSYCSAHLVKKHKFMDKGPLTKVPYDPKCRFCSSEYINILSYNKHIHNAHKEMLYTKKQPSSKSMKSTTFNDNEATNEKVKIKPVLKESLKSALLPTKCHSDKFFKSALFKCNRCDIHFLDSNIASDHSNHLEILINWKCSLCNLIFKKHDEDVHKEQHLVTNDFTVYGITESTVILFNCLKCDIHFDENSYLEHYLVCKKDSINVAKCEFCGILLTNKIYNFHNEHHKRSNKNSNIIIIHTEVLQRNVEHKKIIDTDNRQLRTRDIGITNDDNNEATKLNNMLKVFFCHTCKCFINEGRIFKIHKKSKCTDASPAICKLCGLVTTSSGITSHWRVHQKKKDVTLQDFQMYDLKSSKRITPPMPDFPYCNVCEIYFGNIIGKLRHECGNVDCITCFECGKRFSKPGYKLHMNYHNYKLSTLKISLKHHKSLSLKKSDSTQSADIKTSFTDTSPDDKKIVMIYTCKTCHISLDSFDLAVEHCQGHYFPEKNPSPTRICEFCDLLFAIESFESHKTVIHSQGSNNVCIKYINFDLLCFTSDYNAWIKRVFNSISDDLVHSVINNSIYKHENRIKMKVIQEAPAAFTVYKCDKCQCYIDSSSLLKHLGNLCLKLRKHVCRSCDMQFISKTCKMKHEEIHLEPFKDFKSYRIVLFNTEADEAFNKALFSRHDFLLFQCRNCDGIVSKEQYAHHVCKRNTLKKCSYCGLLLNNNDYDLHIFKHKDNETFNVENIKVILIGKKLESNNGESTKSNLIPSFCGKVYDYIFYRCKSCQLCLNDIKSKENHVCSDKTATLECTQCGLNLESKKLKYHYVLHDSDCNFVPANITIVEFENTTSNILESTIESTSKIIKPNQEMKMYNGKKTNLPLQLKSLKKSSTESKLLEKTVKLYKCSCGLHFLDFSTTHHFNNCSTKPKVPRQQCSKCGLAFTPNILFKHLLSHHGNKKIKYIFDVVDVFKPTKVE